MAAAAAAAAEAEAEAAGGGPSAGGKEGGGAGSSRTTAIVQDVIVMQRESDGALFSTPWLLKFKPEMIYRTQKVIRHWRRQINGGSDDEEAADDDSHKYYRPQHQQRPQEQEQQQKEDEGEEELTHREAEQSHSAPEILDEEEASAEMETVDDTHQGQRLGHDDTHRSIDDHEDVNDNDNDDEDGERVIIVRSTAGRAAVTTAVAESSIDAPPPPPLVSASSVDSARDGRRQLRGEGDGAEARIGSIGPMPTLDMTNLGENAVEDGVSCEPLVSTQSQDRFGNTPVLLHPKVTKPLLSRSLSEQDSGKGRYGRSMDSAMSAPVSPRSPGAWPAPSRQWLARKKHHIAVTVYVAVNEQPPRRLDVTMMGNYRCVFNATGSTLPDGATLRSLGFRTGINALRFQCTFLEWNTVTTASCFAYVWPASQRLVVMDIDGTITQSDVLGMIDASIGGVLDHVHRGLCEFVHTMASTMDLAVMYLTSRPISMLPSTRVFLRNLVQNGVGLCPGPIITNPEKTWQALYREVVARTAADFKAAALAQVRDAYQAAGGNPLRMLVAGFGNRETDLLAYKAVGLPLHNIFIIDPTSRLTVFGQDTRPVYTFHSYEDPVLVALVRYIRDNSDADLDLDLMQRLVLECGQDPNAVEALPEVSLVWKDKSLRSSAQRRRKQSNKKRNPFRTALKPRSNGNDSVNGGSTDGNGTSTGGDAAGRQFSGSNSRDSSRDADDASTAARVVANTGTTTTTTTTTTATNNSNNNNNNSNNNNNNNNNRSDTSSRENSQDCHDHPPVSYAPTTMTPSMPEVRRVSNPDT